MNATRTPEHTYEDESNRLLLEAGRTMWDNAPQLLFASVLLLAAALPGLILATVTSWAVGWPVVVVCTAPVWAGTMAAAAKMLDGDAVGIRAALALIRGHGAAGARIGLVPAIVGAILIGSYGIMDRQPDASWLAVPLLLDLGIAIAVTLALVSIFAVATSRGRSGLDLWLASAGLAFANPVPVLGTATLFGIVLGAASIIGPVLLVVLAPLAVLNAAVVRAALGDGSA